MSDEFYEDKIDDEIDSENKESYDENEDDEEVVYDTSDVYKDDYEYDQIIGKKHIVLSKLNKATLNKDEMDEIFNE